MRRMPPVPSNLLFLNQTSEVLERPVISSFGISRKATAWELASLQVILQTFTAEAFSGARFVAAVAALKVLFFLALHHFARGKL